MIWILELAGVFTLLLVVWVLFRAARARPDERGLRYAAWGGLAAWVVFAVTTLVDLGYVRENMGQVGQNLLIGTIIVGLVLGYRTILSRLRDRADGR